MSHPPRPGKRRDARGRRRGPALHRSGHRFARLPVVPVDNLLAETLVAREGCLFFAAVARHLAG
jgi:hypothetical protein